MTGGVVSGASEPALVVVSVLVLFHSSMAAPVPMRMR